MSEPVPPTVDDPEKPRSPLAMILRPIVLIPLTLIVLAAAIPIVYRSTKFTDIPPIDEIVDRQIDGRFTVDDDKNAFTFYSSAASMLPPIAKEVDPSEGTTAIQAGLGWESISPGVRDHLERSEGALAEWKLGTEKDEAVYIEVATASYDVLIPVTQELRAMGRLAVLQVLKELDAGNPDEAWKWLRALYRSSRHSGKHGFLIERLVGVALHRMAVDAIAVWAADQNVSTEDLQKALSEIEEIHKLTAKNSHTLKSEYITSSNTINRPDARRYLSNQSGAVPDHLVGGYLFLNGEPQLSRVLMRHVFANYISQCDLPPYEREMAGTPLDLFKPTGKESPPLMPPAKLSAAVMDSVLARALLPAVARCVLACDQEVSRKTALELGLKMEMFRRKHGRYPESLEALVPEFISEVPRDRFGSGPSEKMLLIRREPEAVEETPDTEDASGFVDPDEEPPFPGGLIIYSRGRKGPGDDGGLIEGNIDIGIRIPLPRPRSSKPRSSKPKNGDSP